MVLKPFGVFFVDDSTLPSFNGDLDLTGGSTLPSFNDDHDLPGGMMSLVVGDGFSVELLFCRMLWTVDGRVWSLSR